MRKRIALAVRIRDEWELLEGLVHNVASVIDEVWILDDSSTCTITKSIMELCVPVKIYRARTWSGNSHKYLEGTQRNWLLKLMKDESDVDWVLQLDADERLSDASIIKELADDRRCNAYVFPLVDFYITEEDKLLVDRIYPERVRNWFGPEVRWTLALFRLSKWCYIPRGDVREPKGIDARLIKKNDSVVIEHYGKAVSIANWERKVKFYISRYPRYAKKWLSRVGKAVHHDLSDFDRKLIARGSAFNALEAPILHEYEIESGLKSYLKRILYRYFRKFVNTIDIDRIV